MDGRKKKERKHRAEKAEEREWGVQSRWLRMRETRRATWLPLLIITHLHTQTEELHNNNDLPTYTMVKQSGFSTVCKRDLVPMSF